MEDTNQDKPQLDPALVSEPVKFLWIAAGIELALSILANWGKPGFHANFTFALLAAILTWGNFRGASIVRTASAFALPSAAIVLVAFIFIIQPFDLLLTQLRVNPLNTLLTAAIGGAVLWLFAYLVRALGTPEILAARVAAGRKVRDIRLPVGLGVVFGLAMAWMGYSVTHGEYAQRAIEEAQARHSIAKGYSVSSININKGPDGTRVRAVVTIWRSDSIYTLPVEWEEK